jgi:adenylosuccinate synthase
MTNVIAFVARLSPSSVMDTPATACITASVVADLVSMVEEIRDISERVLPLPYDARDVERTIQALLDAISAIEHATDVLTNHGERTPF